MSGASLPLNLEEDVHIPHLIWLALVDIMEDVFDNVCCEPHAHFRYILHNSFAVCHSSDMRLLDKLFLVC